MERALRGAAARFLPGLRDKPAGSAAAGPRHASSRCRAGGWGLRVGAQAVDEVGKAELSLAPQPFGDDDGLDLGDAFLDVAVDDHEIVFRPVAGFLGRLPHPTGTAGGTFPAAVRPP